MIDDALCSTNELV